MFDRECTNFRPFGALLCAFAKLTGRGPWSAPLPLSPLSSLLSLSCLTGSVCIRLLCVVRDHMGMIHMIDAEPWVLEADFRGVLLRPLHSRLQLTRARAVTIRQLKGLPSTAASASAAEQKLYAEMMEREQRFVEAVRHHPYELDWVSRFMC